MRDLLGKLTALDPEARESLKVVGYFDALTARGVGLGGLLRAAAALSGTVAAATIRGTTTAYDPMVVVSPRWTMRPGDPSSNSGSARSGSTVRVRRIRAMP